MAQIGTFTRGEDRLLRRHHQDALAQHQGPLRPEPTPRGPKRPRTCARWPAISKSVQLGSCTSKENTVYHSVKLDDPSFPAPIYANLVELEGGHALVWSR